MKIIVAVCGASGINYAVELLKTLKEKDIETYLVISKWAEKVTELETDYKIDEIKSMATECSDEYDMAAPISSSSFLVDGMIVIPATVKTVSGIANAYCDNLITRAADNVLKMKKRLVVCIRETPLSPATLENLKKISLYGGIVMPLSPGFYHKPKDLNDIYKFIVGKCLDALGIENNEFERWK